MSILPPEAKKAMMAVVAAMGGDDYNYYSDFTTTVSSSSRAKIIANFRVVVPQVQRQRATANLQRNIGDKYVVSAENNQIDVLITGTNKKIRINVKPPVGGGYSAAKKTSIAESAQAVYCQYVVDNAGVTVDSVIDSAKLKQAYDKCVTTGASFEEIESIDPDWKKSSIMGALRLKRPYNSGYKYLRGGDFADAVKDAFGKVNKAQKISSGISFDLNKWSPADIYIAKNGFTVQQLKAELDGVKTWESLNARMLKLMTSKTFIGVSLKKMKSSATLIPVNVSSVDRHNTDKINYEKMSSPIYSTSGYIYAKRGASTFEVNLRTFTSDGGFAGEITGGGSARHGKVGHGPINNILKSHGLPQLPDNPTSRNIANQGTDKMAQWVAKTSVSLGIIKPNQEAEAEMNWKNPKPTGKNDNPVNHRQSKYLTVKLLEIINGINDNDKKNMVIEDMVRYATSTIRGISGPYMKLY
jgi:hypothetical protein